MPNGDSPGGTEMDCLVSFAASCGLNDSGDATFGMTGLCVPDPLPGRKGAGKGNCCVAWLLDADDVGIGGENGS